MVDIAVLNANVSVIRFGPGSTVGRYLMMMCQVSQVYKQVSRVFIRNKYAYKMVRDLASEYINGDTTSENNLSIYSWTLHKKR